MSKILNIVIIGTGNVASAIAQSFQNSVNTKLTQVFNHRASESAKKFAKKYKSTLVVDYDKIVKNADIYIIAVKDDVIKEVVRQLKYAKLKGIVVHTSGSVDLQILKSSSNNIGVYYPLQTFYPKASIDWKTTPLLIEANNKFTLSVLKKTAGAVSQNVRVASSEQRLHLHLAAVFACNFTNALYVSAFELVENSLSKKDTQLLLPIMRQSFLKLESVHPRLAQTGPAMRNDQSVMNKHLSLLKDSKDLVVIYKQLSKLIYHQQAEYKES